MGYRSTVIVGLNKDAYKKAKEITIALETQHPWDNEPSKIVDTPILHGFKLVRTNEDGSVVLQANDVKWYDGYKDVKIVNRFVEDAFDATDDDDDNRNFMVAMGDDDGEIHNEIGYWYNEVFTHHEMVIRKK